MNKSKRYRGRFAPSPTGPLHFGSLVAAVASYCQARSQQGEWLVRIEDIDTAREVPGASDDIIRTLDSFGFCWDAPISYQKNRHEYYQTAIDNLNQQDLLYPCSCSRKQIARQNSSGIYPGTCRSGPVQGSPIRSWRIRTDHHDIHFDDLIQGSCQVNLNRDAGDFILQRADGIYSYQLAVAVDDALQEITEVVRGYDLLAQTSRQIYLQQQLGYSSPAYAHHPIAVATDGNKLSKQTHAPPLKHQEIQKQLFQALDFLGQSPPHNLPDESIESCWSWAIGHWQLDKIPAGGENVVVI